MKFLLPYLIGGSRTVIDQVPKNYVMLNISHDSILLRYLLTYLYSVEVFRSVGKNFQKLCIFSDFKTSFQMNRSKLHKNKNPASHEVQYYFVICKNKKNEKW